MYEALNVGTGDVERMTAVRHTSAAFLRFLDRLVATQPKRRAIHIIADNLSAHKANAAQAWRDAHPRVTMHDTPTCRAWLHQVERWSATIERDVIARGIFTSAADLRRTLLPYIRLHHRTRQPIQWSYSNPKLRIRAPRTSVTGQQERDSGSAGRA